MPAARAATAPDTHGASQVRTPLARLIKDTRYTRGGWPPAAPAALLGPAHQGRETNPTTRDENKHGPNFDYIFHNVHKIFFPMPRKGSVVVFLCLKIY